MRVPEDGDLLIPQFAHEDTMQFEAPMEHPVPNLVARAVRLTWIRDCLYPYHEKPIYRMVRVMDDGTRHGELKDDRGVVTGIYESCPCDYCNMVLPVEAFPLTEEDVPVGAFLG